MNPDPQVPRPMLSFLCRTVTLPYTEGVASRGQDKSQGGRWGAADTSRGRGVSPWPRAEQLLRPGWVSVDRDILPDSVNLHLSYPRKITVTTPLSWPFQGMFLKLDRNIRQGRRARLCPGTRTRI